MVEWKPIIMILLFWIDGAPHDSDVRIARFDTVEECTAAAQRIGAQLGEGVRWRAACKPVAELNGD